MPFDLISAVVPIGFAVVAVGLLGLVTYLRRHFMPRDETDLGDHHLRETIDGIACDVKAIQKRLDDGRHKIASHDSRLAMLERLEQGEPSRHKLSDDLGALNVKVAALTSTVGGMEKQLADHVRNVERNQATLTSFIQQLVDGNRR